MSYSEDNLFKMPEQLREDYEYFQSIISSDKILIERIISTGQKTPGDQWLDNDRNEWVLLLQGESELSFLNQGKKLLKAGDYILIYKNVKHRVESTSIQPPCIWLAVYF